MLSLLQSCFSEKRLSTYIRIAETKGQKNDYAVELYKLNILICQELYAFIDCVEVCLRNKVHRKMTERFQKENWYDDIDWLDKHINSLNEAKKIKNKGEIVSANDVISRLNFGFWCHIFDKTYEQSLWIPVLNKIFPYYSGAPARKHISRAFNNLLKIRNRIAHFEPIIKNEDDLLRSYNQMVEVINWMCPEIYTWFETFNKFKSLYQKLKTIGENNQ